jgi:hypothetical protein
MADQIDASELQQAIAQLSQNLSRLGGTTQNTSTVMSQSAGQLGGSVRNIGQGMARLRMELDRGRVGFQEAGQALRVMQDRFDDLDTAQRSSIQAQRVAADQQRLSAQLLRQGIGEVAGDFAKAGIAQALEYFKGQLLTTAKSIQDNVGGIQMAFNLQNRALDSQTATLERLSAGSASAGVALAMIPGWQAKIAAGGLETVAVLAGMAAELSKLEKEGLVVLQTELAKTDAAFKIVTNAGAVFAGGMGEMRNAAGDASLDLKEFSAVVNRNHETFATLGGSVALGVKRFADVNKGMDLHRIKLLNLGYSYEDQAQGTVDYMDLLQRSGRLQDKNAKDIANETADYLINLKAISAFTGEDAKKAQDRAKEAGTQLAVQSKLMDQGPGAFERFYAGIQTMEPFMQKALQEAVATDGTVIDKSLNQLFALSPARKELFDRTQQDVANKSLGAAQIAENYQRNLKELGPAMATEAKNLGNSLGVANLAVGAMPELTRMVEQSLQTGLKGANMQAQAAESTVAAARALSTTTEILTTEISKASKAFGDATSMLTKGITPLLEKYAKEGVGTTTRSLEQTVRIGSEMTALVLEKVTKMEGALAPGGVSRTAERAADRAAESRLPRQANGGVISARSGGTAVLAAEAGLNEAFVPLPDNRSIPVTMNVDSNLYAKQFNDSFAGAMAQYDRTKKQTAAVPTPGPDMATSLRTAFETALSGPAGFGPAMTAVKTQLADDSRSQLSVMQQQIDRMDDMVKAMQDNVEYSRRIANDLA